MATLGLSLRLKPRSYNLIFCFAFWMQESACDISDSKASMADNHSATDILDLSADPHTITGTPCMKGKRRCGTGMGRA